MSTRVNNILRSQKFKYCLPDLKKRCNKKMPEDLKLYLKSFFHQFSKLYEIKEFFSAKMNEID